jgi:hypothetical protein
MTIGALKVATHRALHALRGGSTPAPSLPNGPTRPASPAPRSLTKR